MPVSYNPTFHHPGWVDNVDRVRAGGDNGFNFFFSGIESELQTISQVVGDIDTAISSLGQQVAAPVTIGLAPTLFPFRQATPQWSSVLWSFEQAGQALGTFVEKPGAAADAFGVLPIDLPNGVRLRDIKVLGEHTGAGTMVTELFQELRTAPFTRALLISVNGLAD